MPLNINEEGSGHSPPTEDGPSLHEMHKDPSRKFPTRTIAGILVLLILAAAGYLVWELDLLHLKKHVGDAPVLREDEAAPKSTQSPLPQAETQATTPVQTKPIVASPPPTTRSGPAVAAAKKGSYTIYISRHKRKVSADEEAGRWSEAGYETTVTEFEGWFRVSIGRYESWDEAKAAAEDLKDAFESGYRVGKIAE